MKSEPFFDIGLYALLLGGVAASVGAAIAGCDASCNGCGECREATDMSAYAPEAEQLLSGTFSGVFEAPMVEGEVRHDLCPDEGSGFELVVDLFPEQCTCYGDEDYYDNPPTLVPCDDEHASYCEWEASGSIAVGEVEAVDLDGALGVTSCDGEPQLDLVLVVDPSVEQDTGVIWSNQFGPEPYLPDTPEIWAWRKGDGSEEFCVLTVEQHEP